MHKRFSRQVFTLILVAILLLVMAPQQVAHVLAQQGQTLPPDWTVLGEGFDSLGEVLADVGDLNNDGFDDMAIGANKQIYIYLGSPEGLHSQSKPDMDATSVGPSGSFFPKSLAGVGDLNGDGYDDMIAASPFDDDSHGTVRVYYGHASGLSATEFWHMQGAEEDSQFGMSVDGAGDINGDGFADVIIGAPGGFDETRSGIVYVYTGSADGLTDTPAFTIAGDPADNRFGRVVNGVGDINADGFDDIMYSSDEPVVYIHYGSADGLSTEPDEQLMPEQYDFVFGDSMDGLGDVNGDGIDDVVVGAKNIDDTIKAYVFYGYAADRVGGFEGAADVRIVIDNSSSGDGIARGVGDINGDGLADLAFAHTLPSYKEAGLGTVSLYFGSEDGLDTEPSTLVRTQEPSDEYGVAVSGAGDHDGDGYGDLLVGAPASIESDEYGGKAYFYSGANLVGASGTSSTPSFEMMPVMTFAPPVSGQTVAGQTVAEASARFGTWASSAGDVNGDGLLDLLITDDAINNGQGEVYLYLGVDSLDESLTAEPFAAKPIMTLTGEEGSFLFGFQAMGVGDVNGDGLDDVLISAPLYEDGLGKVYLYYGVASDQPKETQAQKETSKAVPTPIVTSAKNQLGGLEAEPAWTFVGVDDVSNFGYVMGALGDVNGDDFADVAILGFHAGREFSLRDTHIFYGGPDGFADEPDVVSAEEVNMGYRAASAGDVNGDGFDDMLFTGTMYEGYEGRVSVHLGGEDGVSLLTDATIFGENEGDLLGVAIAGVGDVNGDGLDDVLIGAPGTNGSAGMAQIHFGHPTDVIARDPSWQVLGSVAEADFGQIVSAAGDINSDGYADFAVVGKSAESETLSQIYLYLGGPDGPGSQPVATLFEERSVNDYWPGIRVLAVGNSHDDLLIIQPGDVREDSPGLATLYRHIPAPPIADEATPSNLFPIAPDIIFEGDQEDALPMQATIVGDVDGDGYDDLMLNLITPEEVSMLPRARLYYGSDTGATPSDWFVGVDAWADALGIAPEAGVVGYDVAGLGDINGDGLADVGMTIFAPDVEPPLFAVLIYHGNEQGPALVADQMLETEQGVLFLGLDLLPAGDVNGDGFEDVVISSMDLVAEEMVIALHLGSADGLLMDSVWSVNTPYIDVPLFSPAAALGDINDDGFDDLLIIRNEADQYLYAGTYLGNADGLDSDLVWQDDVLSDLGMSHDGPERETGLMLAALGDVNGDGTPDYAIGLPEYTEEEGLINVYLTDPDAGETGFIDQVLTLTQPLPFFGVYVAGIGDINADGYDEMITTSWQDEYRHDDIETPSGDWLLYMGGPDGYTAEPTFVVTGVQTDGSLQMHNNLRPIGGQGDLNGDGIGDFALPLMNMDLFSLGEPMVGRADVYYGSVDLAVEPEDSEDSAEDIPYWDDEVVPEHPALARVLDNPANENGIDIGDLSNFSDLAAIYTELERDELEAILVDETSTLPEVVFALHYYAMRHLQAYELERGIELLHIAADQYYDPLSMVKLARLYHHGSESIADSAPAGTEIDIAIEPDEALATYYILTAFELTGVYGGLLSDYSVARLVVGEGLALYDTVTAGSSAALEPYQADMEAAANGLMSLYGFGE
ncbi:MAG: FG-GAP-like repeat-containing protein [Chloroflexota bacterium]